MTDGDVPDELLELMPPTPKGGWPDEFGLLKLALTLALALALALTLT